MMKLLFIAAVVAGDYINELDKIADLYERGFITTKEFEGLKADALETHLVREKAHRVAAQAANISGRRMLVEKNDVCMAGMVADGKAPADSCGDDITSASAPAVKALYAYLITQGGNAADVKSLVSKNADMVAEHDDKLAEQTGYIDELNSQLMAIYAKQNTFTSDPNCVIVAGAHRNIGSNGQVNTRGSNYYWNNFSKRASIFDGDLSTTVDAHDEGVTIKTKGPCQQCVKVWGSTYDYHQMAWSMDGQNWKGFAVDSWQRCYGTSCGSGGFGRSQGAIRLPLTFGPIGGQKWQYAMYSNANGSVRIYDMEVVSCPSNGGIGSGTTDNGRSH